MQRRQNLEYLSTAQIDVKQRTIEISALGVLKDLIDARQRTDDLAAKFLQNPLQFERNEPFILREKDATAGQ